ncbi:MAG: hypothetical protein GAK30_00607 [Paracidovorax wautersii]|uniref:UPF0301 protein GAK30_00607 n=1 Tax=Paracidovorax wautersii TaxID=1177982 RepID=A0A7V8FRP5_9BURK|nr:MAG: hypothetical protein GAK30_00607 [Paracidovorax wautersii]
MPAPVSSSIPAPDAPAGANPPINLTNHFLIAMPGLEDELFGKSVVYLCEHNENGALGLMINKPSDFSLKHLFEKVELPLGRADLADQPVFQGGPLQTEHGFVLHDAMSEGVLAGLSAVRVQRRQMRRRIAEAAEQLVEEVLAAEAGHGEGERVAAQDVDLQSQARPPVEGGDEPAPEDDAAESAYASTLRIPSGGLEMTTSRDVLEAVASGAGPRRLLVSLGYASWGQGQLESELAENNWLTVSADASVIFDTPVEQRYSRALSLLGISEYMLSQQAGHA